MTAPSTPQLHLLWVPGTGESYKGDARTWAQVAAAGGSSGHTLMQQAMDNRVIPHWIGYDSTIGPVGGDLDGQSHRDSREIAKKNLKAALLSLPAGDKAFIGGHSQGAGAVWQFVQETYGGQHADVKDRIHMGLYMANPFRPKHSASLLGEELKGWGVANRHGDSLKKPGDAGWIMELEIVNPEDVICNADPDSFVRGIADFVEFFEFEDLIGWATRAAALAGSLDWSTEIKTWTDLPKLARRVVKAFEDLQGYLTGEHGKAYFDKTYRSVPGSNGQLSYLEGHEYPLAQLVCRVLGNHPARPGRFGPDDGVTS